MPSVFSGTQVGFLDPHEQYFTVDPVTGVRDKGKRGKKWRISRDLLRPNIKDQFSPFMNDLFTCNEGSFCTGEFKGTVFRFPLRQEQSKVSRVVYNDDRVNNLFQSFQSDAEISLLFLKNVETVSVYQKSSSSKATLLFQVEVSQESRLRLQSERSQFIAACRGPTADAISRCQIDIKKSSLPTGFLNWMGSLDVTVNNFIIVNVLKRRELSTTLQALLKDEDLNQLPWVGVAAATGNDVKSEGRAFCFLPLPQSERSNLPVHVHGYFGLGDNRRSIKWPDRESAHDKAAIWNKQIIEEILPDAYTVLITEAIRTGLEAERVYQLWPDVGTLTGAWANTFRNTVSKLRKEEILYTKSNGGSWKTTDKVYIDMENNPLIQKVMIRKRYPVVHVPSNVSTALEFGEVRLTKVTPALIRKVIKNDTLDWLTRDERMKLLQFILKDEQFSDLEGVHLLPLQDRTFISFSRYDSPVYLHNYSIPNNIFPDIQARFCSSDCPSELTNSSRAKSATQLKNLAATDVLSVLQQSLPRDWVHGTGIVKWRKGSQQPKDMEWLKKLWTWLQKGYVSLTLFSGLPLIPIEESSGSICLARLQTNSLIQREYNHLGKRTQLSESICTFLESLGAVVVKKNLPDFISRHRDISSFVCHGNNEGVMRVLETFKSTNLPHQIQTGSEGLKNSLISLLSKLSVIPPKWKTLIRDFPIFKSTDRVYVSAKECSSAVPVGLYGIPVPNNRLRKRFLTLDSTAAGLATKLGIQTISEKTLLEECVLPGVEARFYSANECELLMKWVLGQSTYDDFVQNLEFLPTSNGSYVSPSMVFDSENSLLRLLFGNSPVFPLSPYSSSRLLHHLRRIGMKTEDQVTEGELRDIACETEQSGDRARSEAFLQYIARYPKILSSDVWHSRRYMPLEECLSNISWVACADTRPQSYPLQAPWYGKRNILYKPTDVKPMEAAHLVGSVAPLIDLSKFRDVFSNIFGWSKNMMSTCRGDQVIQHLINVSKGHYSARDILPMVDFIYKFMQQTINENPEEVLSLPEDESWVWQGSGFVTSDKVAFSSVIQMANLKPHLYLVPTELQKYKDLMEKLSVKESFNATDFVDVLRILKDENGDNPLNTDEMEAVQDIIKALTTLGDLESVRTQVFAPDTNRVLCSPEELIYQDITQVSEYFHDDELEGNFKFAHRNIPGIQAQKIGIRTLKNIQLDRHSTDDGFELPFGQTEKLTTRLRGILREYSHTPDVLKELLQNADDAGATEIHVVYDPRKHEGTEISGDEWRPIHSLPAICVYNDKPFTDKDIEGIQNVGVGGKISDTTTTGRFGIGFNAVYHLTDCPSFLTQNMQKLCVFDPHVTYIPRATVQKPGKLYTNSKKRKGHFQKIFSVMTQGYLQEFEEFDLSKGTMFRFPLRPHNMNSEISDKHYDNADAVELLAKFESVSKEALLFLNNIAKISISEINQETGKLTLRYSVSADISQKSQEQRRELSGHLERYKDVGIQQIPHMNHVYPVVMKDSKKKDELWLVSQSIGLDGDNSSKGDVQLETFKTKTYLPRGGVAARLRGGIQYGPSGKAFCFLPLQIDTHLPVHVNGTFLLDQSRRNLKKGDEDMIHKWNRLLATHVIGPAYAHLLDAAGKTLLKSSSDFYMSDGQFKCQQYDRLFPTNLSSLQDIWKLVAVSVLQYIGSRDLKVLPVVRKCKEEKEQFSVTWLGLRVCDNSAFFDDLSRIDPKDPVVTYHPVTSSASKPEKKSSIIRTFLRDIGFNLISSSLEIQESFTSNDVGVHAEVVSPKCVLDHLRKTQHIASNFPCQVKDSAFKTSGILKEVLGVLS